MEFSPALPRIPGIQKTTGFVTRIHMYKGTGYILVYAQETCCNSRLDQTLCKLSTGICAVWPFGGPKVHVYHPTLCVPSPMQ